MDSIILPVKPVVFLTVLLACLALGRAQDATPPANPTKSVASKPKVTPPKVLEDPDPAPTSDEGRGPTVFTVTIGADGLVHDPVMTKSSDSKQADANALAAIQKWRFKPATKDGEPIPVKINIEVHSRALGR